MEEDLLVSMENAQISWAVSVVHALMISWVLHVKTEVHNNYYRYDKCYYLSGIHSWYHSHCGQAYNNYFGKSLFSLAFSTIFG